MDPRKVVGATGFEPATPCAQGRCATRLRYAPTCPPKSAADGGEGGLNRLSHNQFPPRRGRTAEATPPRGCRRGSNPVFLHDRLVEPVSESGHSCKKQDL